MSLISRHFTDPYGFIWSLKCSDFWLFSTLLNDVTRCLPISAGWILKLKLIPVVIWTSSSKRNQILPQYYRFLLHIITLDSSRPQLCCRRWQMQPKLIQRIKKEKWVNNVNTSNRLFRTFSLVNSHQNLLKQVIFNADLTSRKFQWIANARKKSSLQYFRPDFLSISWIFIYK